MLLSRMRYIMKNLEWNEVGKYDRKIMWDKQELNLPELGQEVLIFFPDINNYGKVIVGYFYLTHGEQISITDGMFDFGYIREGIKWAEYNRPSQPDKKVQMCENFVCKKYDMGLRSKCNEVPCEECEDGNCVNCKKHLSQSPKCENSKW